MGVGVGVGSGTGSGVGLDEDDDTLDEAEGICEATCEDDETSIVEEGMVDG